MRAVVDPDTAKRLNQKKCSNSGITLLHQVVDEYADTNDHVVLLFLVFPQLRKTLSLLCGASCTTSITSTDLPNALNQTTELFAHRVDPFCSEAMPVPPVLISYVVPLPDQDTIISIRDADRPLLAFYVYVSAVLCGAVLCCVFMVSGSAATQRAQGDGGAAAEDVQEPTRRRGPLGRVPLPGASEELYSVPAALYGDPVR